MRTIPKRLRWLIPTIALGALFLTAQLGPWRNLQVNPAGVADRSNVTYHGIVSGGAFFGSGAGLTGVLKPVDTNGFGGGASADPDTNWWAVIRVDLGHRWSDVEIWISTNGYGIYDNFGYWGNAWSDIVFKWTSTNCALNGVPDYEVFSTNWNPAVFGIASMPHDANYLHMMALYKSLSYPLAMWGTNIQSGNLMTPRVLTVAIRDTGSWFHPSNNLSAMIVRQSADGTSETITNMWWNENADPEPAYEEKVSPDWRVAPIEWIYHDPRPKRSIIFTDGSWEPYYITTPHQQP